MKLNDKNYCLYHSINKLDTDKKLDVFRKLIREKNISLFTLKEGGWSNTWGEILLLASHSLNSQNSCYHE